MQDKQKVTLYLPPQLHRQLKIQSAIDEASMSSTVERAVAFFLQHPDVVAEVEASQQSQGQTHRIYSCPQCASDLVQRDGELMAIGSQPSILTDDLDELAGELSVERVREQIRAQEATQENESLVTC